MRHVSFRFLLAVGLLLAGVSAHAQTSLLNIRGSGRFGLNSIDVTPAGGGTGSIVVDQHTQTGSFAALASTTGFMADLSGQPVGSAISVPNFIVLAAAPTFSATLTQIDAGVAPAVNCVVAPSPGQSCTPSGSALNFLNVQGISAPSSAMSIQFRGMITWGSMQGPFVMVLTTQFPFSYQTALSAMSSAPLAASWSAQLVFTPVVAP